MVSTTHEEHSFIDAIRDAPHDESLRLVFADWLEEHGDLRGELLRLTHTLTLSSRIRNRSDLETRMRILVKEGVEPIGPFWTNSLGMKFVWIPPGTFMMGSPKEEKERRNDETQHKVTITKGCYMGVYTVTQEEWLAVMGNNPSGFKGEKNLPVETVSWVDCQEFINKLRGKDKKPYRLPSEAEWEYACRAGTRTPFFFGGTISTDEANYKGWLIYGNGKEGSFRQKTTPVGNFSANSFGLHGMHGNVWEWCQDWFGDYRQNNVVIDPKKRKHRLLRGGSWIDGPDSSRSASRFWIGPGSRSVIYGLRVCFSVEG